MKDKILIMGRGYIGTRLQQGLGSVISEKRINSFKDADEEIKRHNPAIIINCIGHVGKNNVDDCELDKDKTLFSNSFVPFIIAESALRRGIKLIHVSSGCIYHFDYDNGSFIPETKEPDYFDLFYSRSQIYAARALESLSAKFDILIPRIRIPLDNRPHPKNILNKLIKFGKIIDIANSVTYIPDFIDAIKHLIEIDARGIYNVVAKGGLRYPELMEVYKKHVPSFDYKIIDIKSLKINRTNLILSTEKLEKSGFKVREIHGVIEECISNYLKY